MLKKVLIVPLFLFGIVTGCKKDSTPPTAGVPNVAVNFTINVDNALYSALLNPGGYVYIVNTGYDGLIIFCYAPGSYYAFDRGCPYDCETNSKAIVNVQTSGITAVCPVCGTTYNLYGGTVTKGPGSIALKQYTTNFNDPPNLTVTN